MLFVNCAEMVRNNIGESDRLTPGLDAFFATRGDWLDDRVHVRVAEQHTRVTVGTTPIAYSMWGSPEPTV